MFIFDGITRTITLSNGLNVVNTSDLYSRWKDWVLLSDNAKYLKAFNTSGGEPTSAGNRAPSYFFLTNGWRLVTHGDGLQITVDKNLYSDDGQSPYVIIGGDSIESINSDIPVIEINSQGSTIVSTGQPCNLTAELDTNSLQASINSNHLTTEIDKSLEAYISNNHVTASIDKQLEANISC